MGTLTGTTLKYTVSIPTGLGTLTMDDIDFSCDFYCYYNNRVTVDKDDMLVTDEGEYIAVVDTTGLGSGEVMARITAYIPDSQVSGGVRPEVYETSTGTKLTKA